MATARRGGTICLARLRELAEGEQQDRQPEGQEPVDRVQRGRELERREQRGREGRALLHRERRVRVGSRGERSGRG
jgi:hypothetical protein